MYLSRITWDTKATRNPYEVHRALWEGFPGLNDANRPFLYRIRRDSRDRAVDALVQSTIEPRPPRDARCRILGLKTFDPRPSSGQVLRFLLCANPVKRLSRERCRVPLGREDQQIDWLAGKLAPCARVLEAHVTARKDLCFRKRSIAGKIVTVTFTGFLQVEDPDELVGRICDGIGPAKAFGCGLLSVARV